MGFADMLLTMGIPYDSDEAMELGSKIMEFVDDEGHKASVALAKDRGNFPSFSDSTLKGRFDTLRNATVTTIAPTGTISIIAGASSGIEPIFAVAYVRNVMDKDILPEVNPIFEAVSKAKGFHTDELMKEIAAKGTLKDIRGIPEDVRRVFVTALDIAPEWHVKMQAAFQDHTDNAVSKTVNFPSEATPKEVEDVYVLAYELGCKGVTVYRYGSREDQVLSVGSDKEKKAEEAAADEEDDSRVPRKRPLVTRGSTQRMETGCGHLYVTINVDERGLCEVFTQMGKSGGCTASQSEAVGRLISLALRSGIDPESIAKQLKGIRCPSPLWQPGGMVLSCSDAVAKALERFVKDFETSKVERAVDAIAAAPVAEKQNHVDKGDVCPECPECGSMVEYVEGCVVCRTCGYSKCW